jgi:dTDP-4-dehydrorhamnose 3,5-epimerase-like enzyme
MLDGYKIITTSSVVDDRGSVAFIEFGKDLPFVIKRVYWLYNLKEARGAHAHKELQQFLFCPHGALEVILDDGHSKESIILDIPNKGILITKSLWREIINYQNNPQLIVLASDVYEEEDYIKSYEEFKKWKSHS